MKRLGYLFTIGGFVSMAVGVLCRVNTEFLTYVPVPDFSASNFMHFGESCFIIAITMFVIYFVNKNEV